jgi:glycosyltransferase involved in cell wall biosynthesis
MYGSDRMVLQVIATMPEGVRNRLVVALPRDIRGNTGTGALSRALAEQGIPVAWISIPVLRRREIARGWPVLLLLLRMVAFAAWLVRTRPATVYCSTSVTALACVAARMSTGAEVVLHVHEVWSGGESRFFGVLTRTAHRVVAISGAVMATMPAEMKARTVVIENGVDTVDRPIVPVASAGPVRFLVASRWNQWKGHGTLLDAWDRGAPPGHLVIAGSAPDLGSGVDVTEMVERINHPESVTIVGQVDSIFDLLDSVDVLLVPSDKPEPFGLVAIEAFSRARPVIASDAGGLSDVVDDGVNGLKFEPGNALELHSVLHAIDRQTLQSMGDAAVARFHEFYSAEAFRERMRPVWAGVAT